MEINSFTDYINWYTAMFGVVIIGLLVMKFFYRSLKLIALVTVLALFGIWLFQMVGGVQPTILEQGIDIFHRAREVWSG